MKPAPLHPVSVAEFLDIDLTLPVPDGSIRSIEYAIAEYAVLVSRDRRVSDDKQLAFSRRFGPLEETRSTGISKPGSSGFIPPSPMFFTWTEATPCWRATTGVASTAWTTCSGTPIPRSSRSRPPIRCCQGASSWTRAARRSSRTGAPCDALGNATRTEIEYLVCEHAQIYSREALGFTNLTNAERATMRRTSVAGMRPTVAGCRRLRLEHRPDEHRDPSPHAAHRRRGLRYRHHPSADAR